MHKNMLWQTKIFKMVAAYINRPGHVSLFNYFLSILILILPFFQIWITMPKLYPCYDPYYLVSCTDKRRMNLRLEMLKEIKRGKAHLDKHWYTLKHFVHSLHAVYRLLYKILSVFGSTGMCSKLSFHELQ